MYNITSESGTWAVTTVSVLVSMTKFGLFHAILALVTGRSFLPLLTELAELLLSAASGHSAPLGAHNQDHEAISSPITIFPLLQIRGRGVDFSFSFYFVFL